MEDVNISKYRAQVVRAGSTPASPGFVVSEGQNPVDPSGSGQNHLPVTIATAATGLSITESQVLGGAGTVGQYIRGDGSLADFPATTGGGSSVSYYLNGSVSQGTISGVAYKELNRTPVFGTGTDISINADGYIASFITDALDPNKLLIPGGNWNFETYFSASSSGGNPSFYVELYKYDGTTFTLLATSSSAPELIAFGTNLNPYFSTLAVPETVLALTDRLAVRFYVTHSGRTITLHTEDNHLCQVITTFTTGLTALNGLTSQVQFFAVGTSGTDFAISSASDTHTFNLPTATSTIRGALSSADWSTFNGKQNALTLTTTGTSGAATLVGSTLNIPQYQAAGTYVTAVTASSPLFSSGGTTPNITIQQASGSQSGFLSSTDWTTFNNKQNALTNPVTGTGTTNYLPKFTGASTIGNSNIQDSGTLISVSGATTFSNNQNATSTYTIQNTDITNTNSRLRLDLVGGNSALSFVSIHNDHNYISSVSGKDLYFQQSFGGSTNLTIKSNGNILVGTTTDAGYKLDVNGTGRFSGQLTSGSTTPGFINAKSFLIGTDGTETNYRYQFYLSSNDLKLYSRGYGDFLTINYSTGAATFSSSVSINNASIFRVYRTDNARALELYTTNNECVINSWEATSEPLHLRSMGTTGRIQFFTNSAEALRITSSGNVLIGTTTDGGYKLDVAGKARVNNSDGFFVQSGSQFRQMYFDGFSTLYFWNGSNQANLSSAGAWVNASDITIKKEITEIKYTLSDLLKLKPKSYKMVNNNLEQIGFIAQDVENIISELVTTDNKGMKSLNYGNMNALIVKAIQELKQEIDTLKN